MKLSYLPLGSKKFKTCKAKVTCEHSASSYNIPVVVLEDGDVIDKMTWILCRYKVIDATPEERKALQRAGFLG